MCVVDAYLAFRIDYLALNKVQCFVTFACGLAYSLILISITTRAEFVSVKQATIANVAAQTHLCLHIVTQGRS